MHRDAVSVVLVAPPDVRAPLRSLIGAAGLHVCAEADDARHPLPAADVALAGAGSAAALAARGRPVLVISDAPSEEEFLEAMLAGACGYLPLPIGAGELRAALMDAAAGTAVVPRRFQRTLVSALRTL